MPLTELLRYEWVPSRSGIGEYSWIDIATLKKMYDGDVVDVAGRWAEYIFGGCQPGWGSAIRYSNGAPESWLLVLIPKYLENLKLQ